MASELYDGIISPQGGLYNPGPQVVMPNAGRVTAEGLTVRPVQTYGVDSYGSPIIPNTNPIAQQVQANAVAQALSLGRANGKAAGGGVAAALAGSNQPAGSIVDKSQARLAQGPQGWDPAYGYAPMPKPSSALGAIEQVALANTEVGMPRRRPNIEANPGTLVPTRPQTVFSPQGAGTGVFGAAMSPGMAQRLNTDPRYAAQRGGPAPSQNAIPITVRGGNRTQQALAQVAQASQPAAPAPAPVQPTVQATQWQQDRFQTTEGAGLPSSMGSSRWTTGY